MINGRIALNKQQKLSQSDYYDKSRVLAYRESIANRSSIVSGGVSASAGDIHNGDVWWTNGQQQKKRAT